MYSARSMKCFLLMVDLLSFSLVAYLTQLRKCSVTGGVGTASGLFGGASSDTAIYAASGNNIDFYYGGQLMGQFLGF